MSFSHDTKKNDRIKNDDPNPMKLIGGSESQIYLGIVGKAILIVFVECAPSDGALKTNLLNDNNGNSLKHNSHLNLFIS